MNRLVLYILALLMLVLATQGEAYVYRRGAINVGAEEIKLTIADIDTSSNQITQTVLDRAFPVSLQSVGLLDQETWSQGVSALREIKELNREHQAQEVVALANSGFQEVKNNEAFIQEINQEFGIDIQILPPAKESKIEQKIVQIGGLEELQNQLSRLSDEEYNRLLADTQLRNRLMLLEVMKVFGMPSKTVEVTRGILTSPEYWTTTKQ